MPGRSSDPIGNAPQFEDVQCPVNQVTHTASSCGFRLKDFELPIQGESEVQLYNLSVGLLQCSRSDIHRKVGNVALISPTGVPAIDQEPKLTKVRSGAAVQLSKVIRHSSRVSKFAPQVHQLDFLSM